MDVSSYGKRHELCLCLDLLRERHRQYDRLHQGYMAECMVMDRFLYSVKELIRSGIALACAKDPVHTVCTTLSQNKREKTRVGVENIPIHPLNMR